MKRFSLLTLGCKVNQEEGAQLASLLKQNGWQEVSFADEAELCVINTCTVTHLADRKSRAMLRRAKRNNPQAVIVAAGCFAQVSPQEAAKIEGVDLVVGVDERAELPRLLQEGKRGVFVGSYQKEARFKMITPQHSGVERARAYLKIEDGCGENCAYCIVPRARGPVRSLPIEDVLEAAKQLIAAGHQEIVLSGIHIGAYGEDLPPGQDLLQLLPRLLSLPDLGRLRLGSLEPQQLRGDIGRLIAELLRDEQKFCPHLHIPLQSGCDKTIKAMGRKYDAAEYSELLAFFRDANADLAVTTDIMVGFPGEDEADFSASLVFFKQMHFAGAHVFAYSLRPATAAAAMKDQVSPAAKDKRSALFADAAQQAAADYAACAVGRLLHLAAEREVILDGKRYLKGHLENYLSALLPLTDGQSVAAGLIPVVAEAVWGEEMLLRSAGNDLNTQK